MTEDTGVNKTDEVSMLFNDVSMADFKKLFETLMVSHSDRKLSTLFWNIANPKNRLLVFTNLDSAKLSKVNNNELVFRIVRVKNRKDWVLISAFINRYVLKTSFETNAATISIKICNLITYLNSINYDVDKIDITMNAYFSYSYLNAKDKNIQIANLERDYLAQYRLSDIIQQFSVNEKSLVKTEDSEATDDIYHFKIFDVLDPESALDTNKLIKIDFETISPKLKNIQTFLVPSLDMTSFKYIKAFPNKSITTYMVIRLLEDTDSIKFFNMTCTADIDIITCRPYMQYFTAKKKQTPVKKEEDQCQKT